MRILLFSFIVLLFTAVQGNAAVKSVTYYLDGAKMEYETVSNDGFLEIRLPKDVIAGSLRIKPLGGIRIERIEIQQAKSDSKTAKEITALTERKNLLMDRLKALDTREDIFKAAAKSQSGRTPRKTKNNPEPMVNIRKGTEYAISQLETVYTLRRKTEKELASLESRLSSLQGARGSGGCVHRVWLSANRGRVHISYLMSERRWKPLYDFRLNGDGRVEMAIRAVFASTEKNTSVFVVPTKIYDAASNPVPPQAVSKPFSKYGVFTFPVENEAPSRGPVSCLIFTFKNLSDRRFPAGDAACYLHGEYLGSFPFEGVGPKESGTLSFGKLAGP